MEDKIVLYTNKSKCAGCSACMNICPKGAISMEQDEYGFIYPKIDEKKCIKCGTCKKVCAYQEDVKENKAIKTYAATSKDEKILSKAASGGMFGSIATNFINNKGVVYGCSLEKEEDLLVPKHIRIEKVEELEKIQGSKYVKSQIGTIYKEVKKDLINNIKVLFSGTPCQIDALNSFLKTSNCDNKNLYTIDIICHGTPSTKFFQDYIKNEEKKINGKILDIKFRDKSENGYGLHGSITYKKIKEKENIKNENKNENENKIIKKNLYTRLSSYYRMFLKGDIYRENCYTCKYANTYRIGDITIGDYWGIQEEHPNYLTTNGGKLDEKKGISCIILNSEKGKELLDKYGDNIIKEKSTIEQVAKHNKQLREPSKKTKERTEILNKYVEQGYEGVDKYFSKQLGLKKYLYKVYYAIFK